MARQYSDDERATILAESYELLSRDVTDVGRPENSESEMDRDEEILQRNWRGQSSVATSVADASTMSGRHSKAARAREGGNDETARGAA